MKRAWASIALVCLLGCRAEEPDQDAPLRAKLAEHREQQIQRLHAYATAGEFPHNITFATKHHIFRDADGRYCAVANLIHQDGKDDLVATIVKTHNDLAVHDEKEGPILDWVAQSGLTRAEVERIQFPSRPLTFLQAEPPRRAATPVDQIAAAEPPPPPRPLRATVDALDEDAMKALVRAHLAQMEIELRENTEASLATALHQVTSTPL